MRINNGVSCYRRDCTDILSNGGPELARIELDPLTVHTVLISETTAADPDDNYYAGGESLFDRTTVLAFRDAGFDVETIDDILGLGVYLTPAVKCRKTRYRLSAGTTRACSELLEKELDQFPRLRALLLMGDTAIETVNHIARRRTGARAIPAGSTYRLRGSKYFLGSLRLFPSYLQAGHAYFIEESKREMIAEDIRAALDFSRSRSDSP